MERYEAYKDSGVEWIGEIPSTWTLARTKAVFSSKKRVVGDKANEYQRLALTMHGVLLRDKDDNEGLQPEQFEGYQILEANELVFKLIDLENIKTSRVGLSPYTGIVSPAYITLTQTDSDNRYFYYWFFALYQQNVFNQLGGNGVRSALNKDDLLNLPMLLPKQDEQRAIANYLDARTAEIDALVADCEREAELLREYRKAVISEAVTKGLDPDAPMKDSGVEWIGEIPEGWLVRPSKTLFAEAKELRHSDDEQCDATQKYGIIPQARYIAIENQRMVVADKNLDAWKHVEPGDFVISLRSFQGGLELSEITGCVTWHYIVLKGNDLVEAGYFKYLFKTTKYIESLQRTCTYIRDGQDLRYSNFVQVPLPLPSREEQVAIGVYLDAKTAEIDALIEAKQTMADKLREYRKSLISEAVTGKFKVPGV